MIRENRDGQSRPTTAARTGFAGILPDMNLAHSDVRTMNKATRHTISKKYIRSIPGPASLAILCGLFAAMGMDCPNTGGVPGTGFPKTVAWNQTAINGDAAVGPAAILAADFDGDTLVDLAVGYEGFESAPPRVIIFFRQNDGTFSPVTLLEGNNVAGVTKLASADLDGDSRRDLVAACNGRIIYLRASADPRQAANWTGFEVAQSSGDGIGQWNDVAIANVDGVNGPDIFACGQNTGRLSWFRSPAANIATGTGWVRVDIDATTRTGAASLAVMDMNGDGRLDVISTAPGEEAARIAWYQSPANPQTGTWSKFPIGNLAAATRLAIGDLNADSRPDVIVSNPTGRQIAWYQRPQDLSMAWPGFLLTQYTTATPVDVAVADIDGNSQPDVVVSTRAPGSLRWFTPVGVQTNQWVENNLRDLAQNINAGRFILEDFDGDSRRDVIGLLVGTNTSNDGVARWENPE